MHGRSNVFCKPGSITVIMMMMRGFCGGSGDIARCMGVYMCGGMRWGRDVCGWEVLACGGLLSRVFTPDER